MYSGEIEHPSAWTPHSWTLLSLSPELYFSEEADQGAVASSRFPCPRLRAQTEPAQHPAWLCEVRRIFHPQAPGRILTCVREPPPAPQRLPPLKVQWDVRWVQSGNCHVMFSLSPWGGKVQPAPSWSQTQVSLQPHGDNSESTRPRAGDRPHVCLGVRYESICKDAAYYTADKITGSESKGKILSIFCE